MPLLKFDTPGFVNDLSNAQKKAWSDKINDWMEENRTDLPLSYQTIFFNELNHPEAENGAIAAITWEGFPRYWKLKFPNDPVKMWDASEKLYQLTDYSGKKYIARLQDEYLEWKSYRDANGKLIKVIFTCEGPDYWEFIAKNDEALLLSLYRKYVSNAVQLKDLFTGTGANKQYNRSNKWNLTDGIMHLTHGANTLGAEINLAARATVLRKKGTVDPVSDSHDLICCSGYGAESRFSDPTIGAAVNSFVRQGLSVTLNNPIGLYIHKLDTSAIELPAGQQLKDFWKIIRGDKDKGMILRAEFSVSEGINTSLEDITIGGNPLKYGAQLAELIEMVIYGKAYKLEAQLPASIACENYCDEVEQIHASFHQQALTENFDLKKTPKKPLGLRATPYHVEEL